MIDESVYLDACPEPVEQIERRMILVVEDDRDQASALAYRLENQGYETNVVYSGKQALEAVQEKRPHLIVLDIRLPDINGLQVCEQISDSAEMCDVPVIILSGMERPDIIRCSRSAGCRYFVRKPYDPNALLTLIEHSINEVDNCEW
jgi:DNA-binding response OmpR family regulator